MSQAQLFFNGLASGSSKPTSIMLNSTSANSLNLALQNDCRGYFYSGLISLSDSIGGIRNELFSWATVKAYYSVFYMIQSWLAANGHGIVYFNEKPLHLVAHAGESPAKCAGNSHKIALRLFRENASGAAIISQPIGTEQALDWFIHLRERTNYRDVRFCEPSVPPHYKKINSLGIRKSINAYYSDDLLSLTFDQDHAALAFPIQLAKFVKAELSKLTINMGITEEEQQFILAVCGDENGPIPIIRELYS